MGLHRLKELGTWAIAYFLYSTHLKGVSSMKLRRDLNVTQKTAWHLAHRIRETLNDRTNPFLGPEEVDETHTGGKEADKHRDKELNAGRGPVGRTAVVGLKDRKSGQVATQVVESTNASTFQDFMRKQITQAAQVYTYEARAYDTLPRPYGVIKHSIREYVNGLVNTDGIESQWTLLKRGYVCVYHQMSAKHLGRYVGGLEGRHNFRPFDTIEQMSRMVSGSAGKRLRCADRIGPVHTRDQECSSEPT